VTPSANGTSRETAWAGPIAAGTALYVISYFVWERAGWGSQEMRDLLSNVAFMPLNAMVALLFGLASRNRVLDPQVRRALGLISIASAMVLIGNSISVYYDTVLGINPPVSWADLFYLSDSILTLVALLSFPLARRTPIEWRKFALDATVVLVGGAVAIWYFVMRPMATVGESGGIEILLVFAYPLASLLVLLGVTTVLLRRPADGNRFAFRLLVTATVLSIVADLVFNYILVDVGRRAVAWTDGIYLIVYLLLITSGELYYRRPVSRREPEPGEPSPSQPLSPLPYVAAAGTYGLLLIAALEDWNEPVSGIVVGAVLITVLVLIRQFLAVRQNVRLLAANAARQNEARFRSMVQHSSDVIFVIRPDAAVRFVSPSVTRVFGYEPGLLLGARLTDFVHPEDVNGLHTFLQDAASHPGVTPPAEWRMRRPDGAWLHAETIGTNLLDDPDVSGIVLNTRDVSERKLLEQQLTHQAFHDPLTGLANRALFRDRVSHALTIANRQGGSVAVLFLDLDDFKKVNDSLGHGEGDRLLVEVGRRLRSCARESDTVARLGGDEFAVLIEDPGQSETHGAVVERITSAMSRPFAVGNSDLEIHASTGIATPSSGDSADALLRNADVAMYSAKRQGKGRHVRFDQGMYANVLDRYEMENALRRAIERDELVLHYQPIVALRSGELVGVEALVRWNHPRHGSLVPLHFIPLAEETGLIVPLGRWVLRQSVEQLRFWRERYPAATLGVYVNISGRELSEPDVVDVVAKLLEESGIDPSSLVLEITESILMQQTDASLEKLHHLKKLGLELAIDDFGTGYSSLSYLQRFPIDILKIAKPFVDDVAQGVERSALARAIIGIGSTLKLRTLAEGIEMAEQRAGLVTLGCELGQGYYFARPLPAEAIEAILRNPRMVVRQYRSGEHAKAGESS
jgi:diguanylate cyclase (GGDEF)-like protein/PAS domain S-box-containing protein